MKKRVSAGLNPPPLTHVLISILFLSLLIFFRLGILLLFTLLNCTVMSRNLYFFQCC
jgi:hypothetical protein